MRRKSLDDIERDLYSAVISDCLDEINHRNNCLNLPIFPIKSGIKLAGRARVVDFVKTKTIPKKPYEKLINFLDSLSRGDIIFARVEEGNSAILGELTSTAAKQRGSRGAIISGPIRDKQRILEIGFKVFYNGITNPYDSNGRSDIRCYDCELEVGGIIVNSGDYVFADDDGVVIIPPSLFYEVIRMAYQKKEKEKKMRKVLEEGFSLREAWENNHVL